MRKLINFIRGLLGMPKLGCVLYIEQFSDGTIAHRNNPTSTIKGYSSTKLVKVIEVIE